MGNKGRTRTDFSELSRLATRQHGVVATFQLARLGISRFVIADAAKHGRAHRLHRGVYAVGHENLTWNGHCMAAVLACAPAVASHWTAAWLWGLAPYRPTKFALTVPTRRGHRRRDFFVHHSRLAADEMTEADGIPVTSFERTHLDLAARWPDSLPKLLEAAEKAEDEEGRNRFDLHRFESLLARTAGHAGHRALSKELQIYRPDLALIRSDLERDFRALLRASSLPLPSHNFVVGPFELDCYWPEHRFCVELDTFWTHGSRRSFEEDRKRERKLRRLGIEVERVTDLQLAREPEEVLAAVAEALHLRAPRPPSL